MRLCILRIMEKKRENYKEMTDSKTYPMLLFILEMDKI